MRHSGLGKRILAVVLLALLAPYGSIGLLAQGQRAGQVAGTIPSGEIQRPSGTQPTAMGVEVLWDDLVTTASSGRARVGLDDGSIINIGSGASVRVVKHDAASQQSSIVLTFGQLRARTKLSKPGASFEVRTNTAVIGVIGTDFWVDAQATLTRVIVFEGAVRVTSLDGNREIMVGAGQMVTVPSGQPPSAAASASLAEMQEAAGNTDVGAPPLPPPPDERAKSWTRKPGPWILIGAGATAAIICIVLCGDNGSSSSSSSSSSP